MLLCSRLGVFVGEAVCRAGRYQLDRRPGEPVSRPRNARARWHSSCWACRSVALSYRHQRSRGASVGVARRSRSGGPTRRAALLRSARPARAGPRRPVKPVGHHRDGLACGLAGMVHPCAFLHHVVDHRLRRLGEFQSLCAGNVFPGVSDALSPPFGRPRAGLWAGFGCAAAGVVGAESRRARGNDRVIRRRQDGRMLSAAAAALVGPHPWPSPESCSLPAPRRFHRAHHGCLWLPEYVLRAGVCRHSGHRTAAAARHHHGRLLPGPCISAAPPSDR